jgi:hypothetical protein
MSGEEHIACYLNELRGQLRLRGSRRRRVVKEIEAHLCERQSELQHRQKLQPAEAARQAIARFGDPRQLADQFNEAPRRVRILERRLVALWVAWIAAMGMGTATVWAAVNSSEQSAHRVGELAHQGPPCSRVTPWRATLLRPIGKAHILQAGEHRRQRGKEIGCQ